MTRRSVPLQAAPAPHVGVRHEDRPDEQHHLDQREHPQAVEAGVAILKAGGNAIDAAVATSLAVGVAEPYGSGLGGKLMLLFFEAKSGKTYAVDAMRAVASETDPSLWLELLVVTGFIAAGLVLGAASQTLDSVVEPSKWEFVAEECLKLSAIPFVLAGYLAALKDTRGRGMRVATSQQSDASSAPKVQPASTSVG